MLPASQTFFPPPETPYVHNAPSSSCNGSAAGGGGSRSGGGAAEERPSEIPGERVLQEERIKKVEEEECDVQTYVLNESSRNMQIRLVTRLVSV
jgi:hypothetical protein